MADKQIGIRLDVKSTGLSQVDDSLDTISKNLQSLNENVIQQQQKGWGSDAQTKNLREQLRTMEQMLQAAERLAKTQGVRSDSFNNFRNEIGSMQRDLGSLPTYKSRAGEWAHDRFGGQAASQVDRVVNWTGKAAAIGGGLNLMSTIRSGLSSGTQLAYGYGDLGKRMSPGTNSYAYGRTMGDSLQGFGYTDQDLLQNSATYAAATGRMGTNKFIQQMKAIEQTGRAYGLDLSGVTQNFSSMYQGGVTGGSDAQLSPQEYANLVANAVNRGNMQGKESQVMDQLQQLVQMGVTSSGQAGDAKTMGGMLSIGNSTGNQALINQLPQMLGAINSGIMSPGGGYAGQALMWNAISGGQKMGYFEEQVQASKGAFGVNEHNGKTNIENAMSYLSKTFGSKNIDEESVMFSTLFSGMNPSQAKQFIQAYTNPDGSFKQGALDAAKKAMGQPASTPAQNATDANRNQDQSKTHAAHNAGSDSNPVRSGFNAFTGAVVNAIGTPLADVVSALPGIGGAYSAYKTVKGAVGLTKKIGSKWTGKGGPSALPGDSNVVNLQDYANKGPKPSDPSSPGSAASGGIGGFFSKLLGDFALGYSVNQDIKSWFSKNNDPISQDNLKKKLDSHISGKQSNGAKSTNAPESSTPGFTQTSYSATPSSAAGSMLAPIVASTIIALGPYMGQLKSVLGGTSGTPSSSSGDLVNRNNQQSLNGLMNGTKGASGVPGYTNLSYSPNAMIPSGGSATFSGGQSEFVSKMSPYAKAVSSKTGLPPEFILGQWGLESGWGTSTAAKQNNNFAGIEPWSGAGAGKDSQYAGYNSLGDFANGYANFLLQNRNYAGLLQAARGGASDDALAGIMGHSGYAEDPNYSSELQGAIGAAQGALKVSGSVTVTVKQTDGSSSKVNVPLTAHFGGLSGMM